MVKIFRTRFFDAGAHRSRDRAQCHFERRFKRSHHGCLFEPVIGDRRDQIGDSNVTVKNSHGVSLSVNFAGMSGSGDTVTAVYNAVAPGGAWAVTDDDVCTVDVNANSVRDVNGNPNSAASTTFNVVIPDTTANRHHLRAKRQHGRRNQRNGDGHLHRRCCRQREHDRGRQHFGDRGRRRAAFSRGVQRTPSRGPAATITATYTVTPPGGAGTPSGDGSYTVALTGQVTDTSAHPATATPVTFTVNTNSVSPVANVTANNITAPTSNPERSRCFTPIRNRQSRSPRSARPIFTVMSSHGVKLTVMWSTRAEAAEW